jgi:hypothetical protein
MTFPGRLAPAAQRVLRASAAAAALALAAACSSSGNDDLVDPNRNVPTGLSATATTATTARVSFSAVANATSYIIERAAGATGGTFVQVGTSTTTTFEDTGLNPGQAYQYRVAAVVGGAQSPFSTPFAVTALVPGRGRATISADITANRTLFADTVYTISGFIKVANGATLTVQPGVRVEGDFNTVGSSLFVLRGARINAVGTAENPIVFTSSRPVGQRQPGDWGGLILVGRGIINRGSPVLLEGTGQNTGGAIDYSGGTDNADSSGELRYVRVEFAGFATATDAELNSFTFAAVGSGTKLSYLQVVSGLDDSFEFFGGAADATHLVSYESGDDHFDVSEGYVGRMQHLIALQSRVLIPRTGAGSVSSDPQGFENDGCAGANCGNGQNSTPLNVPLVANFTLVGTGPGTGVDATAGGVGMMLRRGTGGYYLNGVVARWPRAGVSLRDQPTLDRAAAGDLLLRNVLFAQNGTLFQAASGSTVQGTVDAAANALEQSAATAASLFAAFPTTIDGTTTVAAFDWAPASGSAAATGGLTTFPAAAATRGGTVVTGTGYRGAANPAGPKWWAGWTTYAQN